MGPASPDSLLPSACSSAPRVWVRASRLLRAEFTEPFPDSREQALNPGPVQAGRQGGSLPLSRPPRCPHWQPQGVGLSRLQAHPLPGIGFLARTVIPRDMFQASPSASPGLGWLLGGSWQNWQCPGVKGCSATELALLAGEWRRVEAKVAGVDRKPPLPVSVA